MLRWSYAVLAKSLIPTRATFLAACRPRTVAPVVALTTAAVGKVILVLDPLVGLLIDKLKEDKGPDNSTIKFFLP